MNYRVKFTAYFAAQAKQISKKHKGIKNDIEKLIAELEIQPTKGVPIGRDLFKIRLSITGTNTGKSGGARVITYVIVNKETVLLSEIYLKSEHDTIDEAIVIQRLKDQGLI